ncbi:MAG TPA: hypothetical protein VGL61_27885 [Kofleriaceae bacterium]
MRQIIAAIGAWIIYRLIWLFGRTHDLREIPWLIAPLGGPTIGDATYREVADREGLSIERDASSGLVPAWGQLDGDGFDGARVAPLIRDFYEHTSDFKMDVWSKTYFPASIGLALLVTTISRQVDQLNFPLSPLDTAHGITSEIISMREADGRVKYTGWFRTLASSARVLYTGFYMTARVPGAASPCVKVAFPMPNGNATVVLRPIVEADGALVLDSHGGRFGGPGFYRVQERRDGRLRVWMIRTLVERFRVFVDAKGALRCDHSIRFLGLPVLRLHYKMTRA